MKNSSAVYWFCRKQSAYLRPLKHIWRTNHKVVERGITKSCEWGEHNGGRNAPMRCDFTIRRALWRRWERMNFWTLSSSEHTGQMCGGVKHIPLIGRLFWIWFHRIFRSRIRRISFAFSTWTTSRKSWRRCKKNHVLLQVKALDRFTFLLSYFSPFPIYLLRL